MGRGYAFEDDYSGFELFVQALGCGLGITTPVTILFNLAKDYATRGRKGRNSSHRKYDWFALGLSLAPIIIAACLQSYLRSAALKQISEPPVVHSPDTMSSPHTHQLGALTIGERSESPSEVDSLGLQNWEMVRMK